MAASLITPPIGLGHLHILLPCILSNNLQGPLDKENMMVELRTEEIDEGISTNRSFPENREYALLVFIDGATRHIVGP